MQNSLFRRRLAIRACFDVLVNSRCISFTNPLTDDPSIGLLDQRGFLILFKDENEISIKKNILVHNERLH